MSNNLHFAYVHVPILTKDNYPLWALKVKAYLALNDHVHVICCTIVEGIEVDPKPPEGDDVNAKLVLWIKSNQVTLGLMIGTATDLHFELCHVHEGGQAWGLWHAIKDIHVLQDTSLCYEVWMALFLVRMTPGDSYCNVYCCIESTCNKITHVTPANLSPTQQYNEISLFTILHTLPPDDMLCCQLMSQNNISLCDAYLAFLCINRDTANTAAVESANAAFAPCCHCCDEPGHLAKDCPYSNQFRQLVTHLKLGGNSNNSNNSNNGNNGNNGNNSNSGSCWGHGHGRNCRAANAASASGNMSAGPASRMPAQETARVSTSLPLLLASANDWLSDTGATCLMSHNCSMFSLLLPDQCPIHLADGKTVFSEGVGTIRFLLSCDYIIEIHEILFVPSLSISLFLLNHFARTHHVMYSEVTDYLICKWVNQATGAVEFTATITSDDLAYLDWKLICSSESASVSIADLHAHLNHMPFSSVCQLLCAKSIAGVPDHITNSDVDDFCEDCQWQAHLCTSYKTCHVRMLTVCCSRCSPMSTAHSLFTLATVTSTG